jgi:hypothetical protein
MVQNAEGKRVDTTDLVRCEYKWDRSQQTRACADTRNTTSHVDLADHQIHTITLVLFLSHNTQYTVSSTVH